MSTRNNCILLAVTYNTTRRNKQNAFLSFHCKTSRRARQNIMLYRHCLFLYYLTPCKCFNTIASHFNLVISFLHFLIYQTWFIFYKRKCHLLYPRRYLSKLFLLCNCFFVNNTKTCAKIYKDILVFNEELFVGAATKVICYEENIVKHS